MAILIEGRDSDLYEATIMAARDNATSARVTSDRKMVTIGRNGLSGRQARSRRLNFPIRAPPRDRRRGCPRS